MKSDLRESLVVVFQKHINEFSCGVSELGDETNDDVVPEEAAAVLADIFADCLAEAEKELLDLQAQCRAMVDAAEASLNATKSLNERGAITLSRLEETRRSLKNARELQLSLFRRETIGEVVYFQAETDLEKLSIGQYVKIGRTARSETKRRRANQTGNPRALVRLAAIPGASERKIHDIFKSDQIRGEWFRLSPAIMEFIRAWQMVETAFS